MYEELVKRLREPCPHENCVICQQAADAIEELSSKVEELEAKLEITPEVEYTIDKYADDLISHMEKVISEFNQLPRWIPVEERLPEAGRDVQITVFWHGEWKTMYGYYDGAFWHLYAPMHTEVPDVEVIGWMEKPLPMPLPEPPEEEA